MKSKQDMYINYERSNKKRRKRGPKWYLILLIVVLGVGLAGVAFYIVNDYMQNKNQITLAGEKHNLGPSPTSNPTPRPTVSPTPTPTVAPTPTVIPVQPVTSSAIKVKGVYVSSSTAASDKLNSLIEIANTTEVNSLVIDIKDDTGKITYLMDSAEAKKIDSVTNTIKDMDQLVASLKEKNIYLIARIVAFKDPYLAKMRPELAIRNQDGSIYKDNNGDRWVNPYNKEVWNYLIEVAAKSAELGFDEIQFDYIRFSTGKGIANADFGKAAKNKSKEEIITEFTKYAYDNLKPLGINVSADVYGTIISSKIDAGLVGQNFAEMSKYLDYICPMIYPSHFGEGNYGVKYPDLEPQEIIRKSLLASKEKLDQIPEGEHKAMVRPWLQDFTATWIKHYQKYGKEELREQINGVYDAGYEEWLLWNAGCNYTEEGLLAQ